MPETRYNAQMTFEVIEDRGGDSRISGYAAVYYDPAEQGTEFTLWNEGSRKAVERIRPNAFAKSIADGHNIIATFDHDMQARLGDLDSGTLKLQQRQKGLWIDIPYDPSDPDLVKAKAKLQRGLTKGGSFTFTAVNEEWRHENGVDVRYLTDVILHEVTICYDPAYSGTGGSFAMRSASNSQDAEASFSNWKMGTRLAELQARLTT